MVALAIPLFTRNIWRNNFLQAALGAELRLQGCTGSVLDALNTMGLCQNKDTVRLLVHRLCNGKDLVSLGRPEPRPTKTNKIMKIATEKTFLLAEMNENMVYILCCDSL